MGEEVKMSEYETNSDDEGRVLEWEIGLPSADDLTPLSQPLIPPELASAFSISSEPRRTVHDVTQASRDTLSFIRATGAHSSTNQNEDKNFRSSADPMVLEPGGDGSGSGSGSDARKSRKVPVAARNFSEEADSAVNSDDPSARTSKRARLVWTPRLHKRFVEVVKHLGIQNAVPKMIMQLMNVEGLSRENVASHLQKYRQYLKRMQGFPGEGQSESDQVFDSGIHEIGGGPGGSNSNGHAGIPIHMPYGAPPMPVPLYGGYQHQHQHQHQHPPLGMMQQHLPYSHHGGSSDKLN